MFVFVCMCLYMLYLCVNVCAYVCLYLSNETIHLDCVTLHGTRFQIMMLAIVVLVVSVHHIVGCRRYLLPFTLAKGAVQHDLTEWEMSTCDLI